MVQLVTCIFSVNSFRMEQHYGSTDEFNWTGRIEKLSLRLYMNGGILWRGKRARTKWLPRSFGIPSARGITNQFCRGHEGKTRPTDVKARIYPVDVNDISASAILIWPPLQGETSRWKNSPKITGNLSKPIGSMTSQTFEIIMYLY